MQNVFGAIAALLLFVLIAFLIPGCAPVTPEPPVAAEEHPAFPPDMQLACHEGWFVIVSPSNNAYVRLPIRCQQA